jgi:hypothetical protein
MTRLKTKKIKKPLSNRKKLVKKLDDVFSVFIRARDKNKCITCGTTENPTCGHLITRAKYSVRWDERNSFCQCFGCNMSHEYNPEKYTAKWLAIYGEKAYQQLVRDANKSHKFTDKELEALIEKYV